MGSGLELWQAKLIGDIIPHNLYRHITLHLCGDASNDICEDAGSFRGLCQGQWKA
jgi:hypothetical protein